MIIRLDKLLAHSGYGSRKEVKNYIRKGFITVNDKIIFDDDFKVDTDKDEIIIGDEQVIYDQFVYILLNKPENYLSATYDDSKNVVLDLIDSKYCRGLFPVGRLDIDTTGLLLLTNDGSLAHKLLSPKNHVEKEYELEYSGKLVESAVEMFENGIDIDGEYFTKPAKLIIGNNNNARVIITEGKFHQVKRMIEKVGGKVTKLKRVRMKNLWLDNDLELGKYRFLNDEELENLKK